jgi:hypothetical protein
MSFRQASSDHPSRNRTRQHGGGNFDPRTPTHHSVPVVDDDDRPLGVLPTRALTQIPWWNTRTTYTGSPLNATVWLCNSTAGGTSLSSIGADILQDHPLGRPGPLEAQPAALSDPGHAARHYARPT